jgi:site-specific recombinase XerD
VNAESCGCSKELGEIAVFEPRFTLAEIQAMRDCPTLDRSYEATRLGPAVTQHLAWKRLAGRSEATLDDYERTLARMCVELPGRELPEVTTQDLEALLVTWPAPSRRKRKAALNGFFMWAARMEILDRNPCDRLPDIRRQSPRVLDVFSAAEQAALLQAARQTLLPLANQVRIGLLAHGLRKGGCLGLQVRDINMTDRVLLVTEKGDKQRLVPFRGDLVRHLDQYLMEPYPILDRAPIASDHLFFPYRATGAHRSRAPQLLRVEPERPLSRTGYQMWWGRIIQAAGVPYRKAHMMRHTYGTDSTDAGVDLASLAELMGHASTSTTELYVHSSRRRLDKAAELLEKHRREGVRSADA